MTNHKSRIILGNLFTRSWVLSSKALKLRMTSLESLIHRVRERDDDAYEAIVRRLDQSDFERGRRNRSSRSMSNLSLRPCPGSAAPQLRIRRHRARAREEAA